MNSTLNYFNAKETPQLRIISALCSSRNISDTLRNLIMIIEIGTLVILSDEHLLSYLKETFNNNPVLMNITTLYLEIFLILMAQLFFRISLFRVTYLRIVYLFSISNISSIILACLAFVALIIDFLKTLSPIKSFRNSFS